MNFTTNDTFRQIFQSSVEAIIMVDQQGKIILANPVAENMFGYDINSLTGLLVEDLLPEQLRARHVGYRRGFVKDPEPRPMGKGRDLVARRKDNTEFPVEVSLSYTKVDDEILVMAFVSDITERKKYEEALKRSEEQLLVYASELEKKVQSRTEDLNVTIKALELQVLERRKAEDEARRAFDRERELNELKSKFVSIASHEFRTPLSAIMSSASLITQYMERKEEDKVTKHIGRIKSSVTHLTSILNDFLSLGKLEEGKIDVKKELINVAEFLSEVREEISATLRKGQMLHIKMEGPNQELFSDPRILRNILFNLISNGSKYSQEHKSLFLSCSNEANHVIFTIRDEGIGIPQEDQKHMFERFFRASNAGNAEGTGLGLNIVKRYVDLLNGTISFKSEYEKGSVFKVSIPTH